MKLDESKKEELPIDFITSFVSDGWEEVGIIKASIEGIKSTFKDTKKVEKVLQDLIDAYLVCIGQLELYMHEENYIKLPSESKQITEDFAEPAKVEKVNDGEKVEVFTELPDYNVEVEQKGEKVEVEVTPKETDAERDEKELAAFEAAIMAAKPLTDGNGSSSDFSEDEEPKVSASDYFCDFDDPVGDKVTDTDLYSNIR